MKPAKDKAVHSRAYDSPDLFREDTILRIEQLYRDVAEHQRKIQELLQKVRPRQKMSDRPEKADNSRTVK